MVVRLGSLSFLIVSALVIATPGQDTVLTIRNTLRGGRRAGTLTAVGVALGQATWAVLTAVGVSNLFEGPTAASILRLGGAAYLIYLGTGSLSTALRSCRSNSLGQDSAPMAGGGPALRQGIFSNLANPKMAVFFVSLLPQFAPVGDASFPRLVSLLGFGLVFATMTLGWLSLYAALVAKTRNWLGRPGVRQAMEATTGGFLVLFGLRLAVEGVT
jgi:threonine/homoserine/homoserine lactone efflux protein